MFRYERSGVVGGLSRVRQMTLNDGHVFCGTEHVEAEIVAILELVTHAYETLAIPAPTLRLSLPGDGPKYAADRSVWARSETMIRSALDDLGVDYVEAPGEAAFYGPKLDLQVRDPQGREETLSTIQVDFHLPEVFQLTYRHGTNLERPVMIHRSIISTMERMVAHLLEVHNGSLPLWLAPIHVAVLPVSPAALDYAQRTHRLLVDRGIRSDFDDRDDTLAARVRDAQKQHIPYLAVVGEREADTGTVAARLRTGERVSMTTSEFADLVAAVYAQRLSTLTNHANPS
jgi:threonyl-tRNA synthetase